MSEPTSPTSNDSKVSLSEISTTTSRDGSFTSDTIRVFALLIGINVYKSGQIWNLESCVDDVRRMRHWLHHDLGVPSEHICTLLDSKATKANIEEKFASHLVFNEKIQRGDAIFIYFAGHGSSFETPPEWRHKWPSDTVEVLCTYDHDAKNDDGRIAGISVKAMQVMISDLHEHKGDNITLVLDCCSSPLKEGLNRGMTRWTPTLKATTDDLKAQFYQHRHPKHFERGVGFYQKMCPMHILLAACGPGEQAVENKDGGKFTSALLNAAKKLMLHQTSYVDLIQHLMTTLQNENMNPQCVGAHKDRIVFAGVPFVPDPRYFPIRFQEQVVRIEVGENDGVATGNHLSLHRHNLKGSLNPPLDSLHVLEVHDTWSIARLRGPSHLEMPEDGDEGYWVLVKQRKRDSLALHSSLFRKLATLF